MFKFFNFRNNPDIAWNLFDFMLVSMGASWPMNVATPRPRPPVTE